MIDLLQQYNGTVNHYCVLEQDLNPQTASVANSSDSGTPWQLPGCNVQLLLRPSDRCRFSFLVSFAPIVSSTHCTIGGGTTPVVALKCNTGIEILR